MKDVVRVVDTREAPWLKQDTTLRILEALQDPGEDLARFVGGCVRNTLLGRPFDDIDIATVHEPETVIARLDAAGLKAVGTGIAHGTVTGIVAGKPFEITTLRRDVATDGRRAVIAFTTDWAQDARRRDFTMNALYLDAAGRVYDPVGGMADLELGRVRFIGAAVTRIREDYLRILRFFRMHAWYGAGAMDADGLAAVAAERAGLAALSGERIQREMGKLLLADAPLPAMRAMADCGVLSQLIDSRCDLDRLAAVIAAERDLDLPAHAMRRLAGLAGQGSVDLIEAWRLSRHDGERLTRLADVRPGATDPAPDPTPRGARRLVYARGSDGATDRIVMAVAGEAISPEEGRTALAATQSWRPPKFPVSGADILAKGVAPGAAVGALLESLEEAWVDSDFTLDRPALLARLTGLLKAQDG